MKKYLLTLALSLLMAPSAFCAVLQGTVNSITPGRIMISIWGSDKEEDFKIPGSTFLFNIHSLDDLRLGDKVKITYGGRGYHKIAYSITKQTQSLDLTDL